MIVSQSNGRLCPSHWSNSSESRRLRHFVIARNTSSPFFETLVCLGTRSSRLIMRNKHPVWFECYKKQDKRSIQNCSAWLKISKVHVTRFLRQFNLRLVSFRFEVTKQSSSSTFESTTSFSSTTRSTPGQSCSFLSDGSSSLLFSNAISDAATDELCSLSYLSVISVLISSFLFQQWIMKKNKQINDLLYLFVCFFLFSRSKKKTPIDIYSSLYGHVWNKD